MSYDPFEVLQEKVAAPRPQGHLPSPNFFAACCFQGAGHTVRRTIFTLYG